MPTITPFLWFDGRLEEAVAFYTSVFKDARVDNVNPMTASFELLGQKFLALNGGPQFRFNEAVSFFIDCQTQTEIDDYWSRLTADGGYESRCGWLKDRFGLSWQVVPKVLAQYLSDGDRARANRVLQAMLKMNRIDIEALHAAFRG